MEKDLEEIDFEEGFSTTEYPVSSFTITPLEETVIAKAVEGDEKAFENIFMGTYRYVFATVRKYLKNDQDAYDAIQDTYTKVYKSIGRLESVSSFYPWLHRIAENCAKDILNINGRDISVKSTQPADEGILEDQSPQSDITSDVTEVLKQLPKEQADLLVLVYYDKMRVSEIAKMQGVPVTTVHNRLNASKKKLKELLKIRGIEKPIYGGDFISMISLALRNAIGTELLSMAVAEEILHNVTGSQNQKGAFVISRFARKERTRAALKIATILLLACLLITAVALLVINIIIKPISKNLPLGNSDSKDVTATTSEDSSANVDINSNSTSKTENSSSQIESGNVSSDDTKDDNSPSKPNSSKPSSSEATTSTVPQDNVKLLGSFITTEVFGTNSEKDNSNMAASGNYLYAIVNNNLISLKKNSTSPTVLIKNFSALYGNSGKCLNVYNKKVYWVNKNSNDKFVLNRCNIDGTAHYSVVFDEIDCTYLTKMVVAKDGIYFCAGIHGIHDYTESGILYQTDYNFNIQKQLSGVASYALLKDKLYYLYGKGNHGYPYSADRATFENRSAVPIENIHIVTYSAMHSLGDYVIFQGYSPYGHSEYGSGGDIKILDTVSGKLVRFIYAEADDNYDITDASDYGDGNITYKHFGNTKVFNVKTGENKIVTYSGGTVFGNYRYFYKSNSLYRSNIDGKSVKKIY